MSEEKLETGTYLDQLYKTLDYSQTEFDKTITYVSSGILAVSYAFIDKIVNLKIAHFKGLLTDAWIYIGVAIFISLLGHFISIFFLRLAIGNYETNDNNRQKNIRITSAVVISIINIAAVVLILIGSLTLFNFIKYNI